MNEVMIRELCTLYQVVESNTSNGQLGFVVLKKIVSYICLLKYAESFD